MSLKMEFLEFKVKIAAVTRIRVLAHVVFNAFHYPSFINLHTICIYTHRLYLSSPVTMHSDDVI